MKVNTINLTNELIMSGITTHGNCNSNGVVWDDNNNEIQDRKDVKAVLAKHDPTPIIEETLDEKIKRIVSEELRK